ncbi:endonuclease MutS2 [uncultured Helicobacter sp.]|uniref:endonuclease MutS2 n=1 Tax=uncultured Helicobacter sp. TaxID=175537 RepID=UPI003753006D
MRPTTLINALDLEDFIHAFEGFLAREKDFVFSGDRQVFVHFLQELESTHLSPPPKLKDLQTALTHLQKFGTLGFEEIFEFVKLMRYFAYLKRVVREHTPHLYAWLDSIHIPPTMSQLCEIFEDNGELKSGIYPDIDGIKQAIAHTQQHIAQAFSALLSSARAYLVDQQIHYINQTECLLLKAGFNNALKGIIISRSANGFFYVLPQSIAELKTKQSALNDKLQSLLYELCKELSASLQKQLLFLRFLNKEFDTFDHIYARHSFARAHNLQFVYEVSKGSIVLKDFCHPVLKNPKPLSIKLDKKITLITGVNAGGKTILLKSILCASLLSKYLLPFKINAAHSKIPLFKNLFAIISDPQNSKNDISTFAGRMVEFAQILGEDNFLLGIDEIELGTDSDEAASLYKVLLEHLSRKHCRIILTTHHKNLAALMANREDVGLIAALYDEGKRRPRYEFLQGSIGKSYAFETAQNYGIPASLVSRAKEVYGEEKLHLNELIERSSTLELELKQKLRTLEQKEQAYERKTNALNEAIARAKSEYARTKAELERTYHNALNELKKHMKENDNKNIHRGINAANAMLKAHTHAQSGKSDTRPSKPHELKKGDYAKYGQSRGVVVEIMGKMCVLELDNGVRLKLPLHQLKPTHKPPQARKIEATPKPSVPVNVSLDLHGKRVEEALEELGNFLSNALIAGFDEVLVYHGIGTGRLSAAVAEFLKSHPKVRAFEDAPMNLGGFGAKVVRL